MGVTIEGREDLIRRLRAIGETKPLLRVIQHDAIAEAKKLVPRKTGDLGRSIVKGAVTDSSAIIEARMGYAAYVEFPTKPHKIRAKNGKTLAFPSTAAGRNLSGRPNARAKAGSLGLGKAGGGFGGFSIQLVGTTRSKRTGKRRAGGSHSGAMAFPVEVNHPGTKAQPFLVPGAKAALLRGGFKRIIETAWNRAA